MDHFNIGGYHIKGYKEHDTMDGVAYVCTIWREGRKVGSAEQSGRGGSTMLYFADRAEQTAFEALATSRPAREYDDFTVPADGESLVEELITGWQFDRESRKKIVVRTSRKDDLGDLEIKGFKAAVSPAVLRQLKVQDPAITHYWETGKGWKAL
ncbi:hypothetical protein [Deinococcus ficus]|uniref:RES domain-containing protein n=1 Tax=Deinococcus ficus TaxID=317577 RepID=A0A221T3J0_9DEIO|nr:hypothetical protein [Deinococcus ficus]ASN83463.1 hypothetical protein DFI_19895 [Deinococcus ficus]